MILWQNAQAACGVTNPSGLPLHVAFLHFAKVICVLRKCIAVSHSQSHELGVKALTQEKNRVPLQRIAALHSS